MVLKHTFVKLVEQVRGEAREYIAMWKAIQKGIDRSEPQIVKLF
jgi:hypothetical protein